MILIADSGSTKTTWMEVASGDTIVTEGLNPHFTGDEQFLATCSTVRQHYTIHHTPYTLHFYGAGCGSEAQRSRVKELLSNAFGTNNVHVETDMLGACRAICGQNAGLVGILGTGSNACYYDGTTITYQSVSTGYILGDHGSANHVGRRLLQGYLTGTMPNDIKKLFHKDFPLTNEQFMDAVYHQPNPNRFLASLAPFALRNEGFDYCFITVLDCLKEWYHYQLTEVMSHSPSHRNELNIVGGFGAAIKAPMTHFEEVCNVVVKKRIADPTDGLRHFHHR